MGIYLVTINNFKRSFQHKGLFIITLLLPVILCMIAGSVSFGKTSLRVGILGVETNAKIGEERIELYDLLNQSKGIKYAEVDEKFMNTDLITGKFQVILDYRESSSLDDVNLISNQKEKVLLQQKQLFQEAIAKKEPIQLSGSKKKGLSVTERSLTIILSIFMIMSTVFGARIIGDKQYGVVQRYKFANKSSIGYVGGYVIYNFLIIYIQVLLCMVALQLVQKNFSLTLTEGIVLPIIITGIAATFSMLICLGSKSEVQANISASAMAAVLSLLGGTFVAVDTMPGALKLLSLLSPIRWVVEILKVL